ncbi:helix-turn-helix domain-containing protein [Streptomyces sp. NPDC005805]|uniref:helix-turn-helix domain-containing protein n=1 Tax=Streptomyces sp. NPDC005805 TaxID=3157068 RepID=UPI0033F9EB7A
MLLETAFQTEDMARGDRFDAWRECMGRTLAPLDTLSVHAEDFNAHQQMMWLDAVSVWPLSANSCSYRRTSRHIRRSDPERYHLTLVLPGSGSLRVDHAEERSTHGAHDLYFLDTSRPFYVDSGDERAPVVGVGVEIPKVLLPSPRRSGVDRLVGRRLSGTRGFGAMVTQFLVRLTEDDGSYRQEDASRLGTVLVDLVAGMVAQETDAEAGLPERTRTRNQVRRIRAHIQRHLHDPALTPGTVAAAHHLSTRQLHRLFEGEQETVAGLIRRQRLERARRDLADPALLGTPVHAVAARWGFTAAAHFSRAFHAAYGTTPSDFRRSSLRASAPRRAGAERGAASQRPVAAGQGRGSVVPAG